MRAVRCDACGAKAMIAAAKCPTCGHLFALRDGFGELLPLGYCSACDSYYPASVGECKWCGTKPERAPIGPQIWRGVGAAALVLMVGTAWLLRDAPANDIDSVAERRRAELAQKSNPNALPPDTAIARTVAQVAIAPSKDSTASAEAPIVVPQADPLPAESPDVSAPSADLAPPLTARPSGASSTKPTTSSAKSRRSVRWVSSVSRGWVIVRAGASKNSRIVASIGPSSRVQLGETRGSWRRIKAKGLAGWVEPRSSFYVSGKR